jgi:hypothetical protein
VAAHAREALRALALSPIPGRQTDELRNSAIHYRRIANGTIEEGNRVSTGGAGSGESKPTSGQEIAPNLPRARAASSSPTLLQAVAATTDPGPIDLADSGGYLYAESGPTGTVYEYAVDGDGTVTPVGTVTGLPAGMEGIAAT